MNGILLIDKPIDWTSHDVVNFVRKRLRIKKVGHGGTLDPIATGLLVLFLGHATKMVKNFQNDDKEYLAVMGLGCETFTNDGTGEVLKKNHTDYIPLEHIKWAFSKFVGTILQKPPRVSAVKLNGTRLYKLALKGKDVDPKAREREIISLDILHYHFPYIMFKTACSKGTYIRKLCSDIGETLGCGAYMSSLIRLRSGKFDLKNTVTIDMLRTLTPDEIRSRMAVKLPDIKPKTGGPRVRRFA